MKRFLLCICVFVSVCQTVKAQISYTWNGSSSTAWNTAANWTPNGIPGAADNVKIVTAANSCTLNASTHINNFTLTSGTLDLGTFALTADGTLATFTAGTIQNGSFAVTAATTTTFGNGPVIMNCPLTITSAAITIKNTTFQSSTTITKTGSTNDASSGGNIFNSDVTMNNTGIGYLLMGNGSPDQFNGAATFINTGGSNLYVAYNSSNNIFNGTTIFTNSPSGNTNIYVGQNSAGTVFNGDIIVNSTSGQGIQFGNNGAAAITLASGKTISIGSGGFTVGTLLLRNFTQTGATAQNVTLTGAAILTFGPNTSFDGDVTFTTPTLSLNGATFNGASNFTKTGATGDWGSGNNVFNGVCSITNSGTSYLVLGNGNPDTWNNDVTFTDNGSERLLPAWNSVGNQFNGNIYVNTSGSATGIQFCGGNSTATATLAAGKVIQAGSGGLTAGYLYLKQFTQLGTTPQNLVLTGTGSLNIGPLSTFNGNLTSSSPALILNGCTFNGTTDLTKTGTTGDWSQGNNVFNGVCSITNSGSSYIVLGNSNPDTWNNDVTFTDNGSERILPAWASAGNQFNGNIYVNTAGSATGVQFCGGNATATATLAAGKTIQAGSGGLTAGYLYLKQFTQLGNAAINIMATGTSTVYLGPNSNFGGSFSATAPNIWAQGATYNSDATFTKTGGTYNHNNQNQNIFNSTCTINQQSNTGYFMLGYNSNDLFNDDITVTASGTGGIYLGWTSGTGTPTLAAGKTIQVGTAGFSAGFLYLNSFTQLGNAPINLNFTGATTFLAFARNSVIGGDMTSNTPDIYFNGCTFSGIVNATKTGTANDGNIGNNIFQGSMTLTNSGTGYVTLGNNFPDTFNSDATFNSTGSSYIGLAWNAAGTLFNGNITVSSTNSATGILFCSGASATATQAAGYGVQTGPAGFSTGALYLRRFTQLGNTPINLTLTGATTLLQVGPSSAIGGTFTAVSPRILLNGAIYSDVTTLTKTGATGEWSNGGNTFNSTLTVNHQGGGYFGFANGAPDIYNGDVYANNNSTERIIFGNNPTGNQFNGNIILTQVGSSVGIAFGWSATTDETQAAGKTISIGSAGFTTGYLQIERFTQLGNAAMNLPLTGSSSITFGPTSTIGGAMTSTSGSLFFNGCTFNGTVNATKTAGNNDYSSGNNLFNANTVITNAGTGQLILGNGNRDQFMTTATFNNTGSSSLYIAHNSTGNVFGGMTIFNNSPTANTGIYISNYSTGTTFTDNILVSSTSGQGIQFCTGNTTATATLAASKTLSVGSSGFTAGTLLLRQFTQTGGTAQSLSLTGTSTLTFGPSSNFGGSISTISPALYFNGCVFNGVTNCTKTGSTSDASQGNNQFNAASSFTNNGTGYLLMTNNSADAYNSDVTFTQGSTGLVYPNYNNSSPYAGNITVNSPAATSIVFGSGNGIATLSGSALQTISAGSSTPAPTFTRLIVNNGNNVTLNTPVNVSVNLVLTAGLVNTTTTNILTMLSGSTVLSGDALSTTYINGPMRYKKSSSGVSTLNFPIGNAPDCRPVVLTVNHTSGNVYYYTAQLFNASAAALGYTLPPSVDRVSAVHYYTIGRTNSTNVSQPTLELNGNQQIQVYFGANDIVTDGGALTVVKNTYLTPTKWIDIGGVGGPTYSAGADLTGSITSTSAPTAFNSFSTFALGNKIGGSNILPIGLLRWAAQADNDRVDLSWTTSSESNNNYFTVERSRDGSTFEVVGTVATQAPGGNSSTPLDYASIDRAPYSGVSFYRLKQTDLDGTSTYSAVVSVSLAKKKTISVYPNPTTGTLHLNGVDASETSVKIEWFDLGGRSLLQGTIPVSGGFATLNAPFNNGMYTLRITASDGSVTLQNVIIMK